jgi:hypothetical protein
MKSKINLSGLTIAAAALIVAFAGSVQAIPITRHAFTASQAARTSDQRNQTPSLATSATDSISSTSSKLSQSHARQRPDAGNLILPISDGLASRSDRGAYPAGHLHGPLLPPTPITLPPPSVIVTNSGGASQNSTSVPDGGVTAALLAGSLGGLVLLRKKLQA